MSTVAFSPDGALLAASSEGMLMVWTLDGGKPLLKLDRQSDKFSKVAFSPDGAWIANMDDVGKTKIWDLKGKLAFTFSGTISQFGSFSPDGRRLVTGGLTTTVWDLKTGEKFMSLPVTNTKESPAIFSPQGDRILTASNDLIAQLWDAESGKLLHSFEGHAGPLHHQAFSPDGKEVVTCSEDQTAKVWSTADGSLLATLNGHSWKVMYAAYSHDGSKIVTASDKLRLWDAKTKKSFAELEDPEVETGYFSGSSKVGFGDFAAFSPDDQLLIGGTGFGWSIWDAQNGKKLETFEGPALSTGVGTSMPYLAQFDPDGKRIVTPGTDIWIWERRRAEGAGGVLSQPDIWLFIGLGAGFLISIVLDRRQFAKRANGHASSTVNEETKMANPV